MPSYTDILTVPEGDGFGLGGFGGKNEPFGSVGLQPADLSKPFSIIPPERRAATIIGGDGTFVMTAGVIMLGRTTSRLIIRGGTIGIQARGTAVTIITNNTDTVVRYG